jgi:hypothetical protein
MDGRKGYVQELQLEIGLVYFKVSIFFFLFQIIQNNVGLPINMRKGYKMYMGKRRCVS